MYLSVVSNQATSKRRFVMRGDVQAASSLGSATTSNGTAHAHNRGEISKRLLKFGHCS
jgi:hypothetical protein